MRVGFCEWPEGLEPTGSEWRRIADQLADARPDLLITNELPFGPWIADQETFHRDRAGESIEVHAKGFDALMQLAIPTIVSSRPVWATDRLFNQAVAIEGRRVRPLHTKHYFPDEPGWYETRWYEPGRDGFVPSDITGLRIGVMLCTDAMFNEHARHYGRRGAVLIAIPRAAGMSIENWLTAGRMAALVSGSYVVSSNRVGRSRSGTMFGGVGFAYAPDGTLLSTTDPGNPLLTVDVERERAARQRSQYPCYVAEWKTS
jgi:N-carbamoylputrescine amidase